MVFRIGDGSMSEHLFLGDSTYPHTPSLIQRWAIDPEWQHEDIEILEDDSGAWVTYKDHKDRIEQLERELAEYKKGSDEAIACQLRAGNKIFRLNGDIDSLRVELEEAQKGHARYEYMRKITPQEFKARWLENLKGNVRFDDLVDAAINRVKA
jgi:hypothetical protein